MNGDDCRSYNLGIGTVPEVVLPKPPWSSRDQGIAVDACIANVVQAVWDAGFVTLGSCCGHGIEGPELVLGDGVQAHDVPEIERIIARHDTRRWTLLQWQLVPLNTGGQLDGNGWEASPCRLCTCLDSDWGEPSLSFRDEARKAFGRALDESLLRGEEADG